MDWLARVWFQTGARDFSLLRITQSGSGTHPASYPRGTGEWSGWGMKLFTHLHLVLRLKMVVLTSTNPHALMNNFALSSVAKSKPRKKAAWSRQKVECLLPASCCFLALVLSLNPKEAGIMFLWNVRGSKLKVSENDKKILDNLKPMYFNFIYTEVI
jgi:hypothetical protein